MRLISIEISGFKSFAKRIHLRFEKGVTGIIGPNGSGKSNIAEAIAWVLGEQSNKALRGKERSDVIHVGKNTRAVRAQVTLTFDNESGRFPVAASEIAISRSLSRDGESEYLLNNEPIRLLDLTRMLAEAGIGTKGYAVISQGMVDRYLRATPAARKELFDEATGIKSLQIKLHQARQKLEKTNNHADEVRSVLAELAPRITFLERQMRRYDLRDQYVAEFKSKQLLWYHHAWHDAKNALDRIETDRTAWKSRIGETKQKRLRIEQKALQAFQTMPQSTQHITEQLLRAQEEYDGALQRYRAYEEEKASLAKALADTKEARKQAEIRLREKRAHIAANSWANSARSLLSACKTLLQHVISGTAVDISSAKDTLRAIQSFLQTHELPESDTLGAALQEIEQPIQDVARLRAIEQEKAAQLAKLQEPPKPSDHAIRSLTAELETSAPASEKQSAYSPADLERAREEEIHAQREESAISIAQEQAQKDLAMLEQEILRECGTNALSEITTSLPAEQDTPTAEALRSLSAKISEIGERDPLVAKEYEEAKGRHDALAAQLSDIEHTMASIEQTIESISSQITQHFQEKFAQIRSLFRSYFANLFGGGSADLLLSEEGIEITVTPPNKRPRHIGLLSGGEKTLTSLALVFAILDVQNPPFIVLDEVDAALDEANSKRFADLLRSQAKTTQRIVISHNRETMAASDVLYGVTMHTDGTSHIYSVKLEQVATRY